MTEDEMNARIAELEAEKEALGNKNKELLGKVSKAKTEIETAKTAAERAEEEAARKAGDIEALEKKLADKYGKQIESLTAERDNATKSLQDSQVKTAIQTAFAQHNVLPEAHEFMESHFANRVQHADGVATVDGKPIGDALAEYFKSDKAKAFISASANSGVGPTVGAGKNITTTPSDWSIDAFTKMKATDPAGAASWASKEGHGYLNNI